MFICICNAITERQVHEAVADGASTLSDLQGTLGVGTCCGCCTETAVDYLPGGRYAARDPGAPGMVATVADAANDAALAPLHAVAVRRAY